MRLGTMAKMFKVAFHLTCVANFAGIIYSILTGPVISKKHSSFGGHLKFLTVWNLLLQLAYFVLALVNDLAGSDAKVREKCLSAQKVRDFVFATLAFPLGMFVTMIFWAVFVVDRELIFPIALDKYVSLTGNHMMHTAPAICQVLEVLTSYHDFPSKLLGAVTIGSLCLSYLIWICYIAYVGGFWVYPILKVLSPPARAAFIVACIVLSVLLYFAGELIHRSVWQQKSLVDKGQREFKGKGDNGLTRARRRVIQKAD